MIYACQSTVTLSAVVALAACSGGGGGGATGPDPVFATPVVLPTDYDGKTFPVRYLGVDVSGGGAITRFRGTGTAEFISEEEITVTIDGTTYALVDTLPIDGSFESATAVAEFNQFSPNIIGFDGTEGATRLFFGGFGFQTDPADMPTSAVPALYTSTDTSSLIVYGPGGGLQRDGNVFLVVNFDAGTIAGDMFSDSAFVMSIANGSISGNTFDGTVTATYDDGMGGGFVPVNVTNSDVDGYFHGSTALDMLGTFEGDFAPGLSGGAITGFVGGFIAQD